MTRSAPVARIVLRFYKLGVSPWLGTRCRFLPTCSTYLAEAVIAHGAVRGGWLGLRRVCRCHPWGGAGYDPVPPSSSSARPSPLKCEA